MKRSDNIALWVATAIIVALVVFAFTPECHGVELMRKRNTATRIVFPIVDSATGDLVSSAAGLDSEFSEWGDGTAATTFTDCTNEASEIATSSGMYELALATTEVDSGYTCIKVTSTTTGALPQIILIQTLVGDPEDLATTDDGTTINVASGVVEANVEQIADDAVADGGDGLLDVNIKEYDGTDGTFASGRPEVNVSHWDDDAVPAATDGTPEVNVEEWDGTDVPTPAVAGYPYTDVILWKGGAVPNTRNTGVPLVEIERTPPDSVVANFKATGFSTHSAADVWTATGGDSVLSAIADAGKLGRVGDAADTLLAHAPHGDDWASAGSQTWNSTQRDSVLDAIADAGKLGIAGNAGDTLIAHAPHGDNWGGTADIDSVNAAIADAGKLGKAGDAADTLLAHKAGDCW
jgi:hypothetical protein